MQLIGRALIGGTSCQGEIEDDRFHVVVGDVLGSAERNGQSFPMDEVTLGTPLDGVRFFNVMGGFVEPGTTRPPERLPMWLPKATEFPSGDHGEVPVPKVLTKPPMMESELAVVIGRPLRRASVAEAHDAIFGWTVFNDFTAPEFGFGQATPLWATAKSIDGFTAWGPWIRRDLSEERVMQGLAIDGYVNGEQGQAGNTKWFAFTPSEMVSHISQLVAMVPGDVVALGTPYPAPELAVGDHVVCEVEEVGTLNSYIVDDDEPRPWPRSRLEVPTGAPS
ncbi:MAG TPA: fumarylacetoacetate hydrolase family protein [Acidimicrobiia bacterium]|jgi:2-keto-4-pentenoate hydratase/2-oxohepta-3-ene-1,7-dioic acid hydratase in catechol pathway